MIRYLAQVGNCEFIHKTEKDAKAYQQYVAVTKMVSAHDSVWIQDIILGLRSIPTSSTDCTEEVRESIECAIDDLEMVQVGGIPGATSYKALEAENQRLRDALEKIAKMDYSIFHPVSVNEIAKQALKEGE